MSTLKQVVDKRLTARGQVEYLVIYKGQNNPQWEPIINLKKELDMLADFEVEYEMKQQKQKQQEKEKQQEAIRTEEKRKKQKQMEEEKAQAIQQNEDQDQESEYEVEEILEKRMTDEGLEYKVKWKGYPISESTWEPANNLDSAQSAVDRFKEKERRAQDQIQEVRKTKKIKVTEEQAQKPVKASNDYNNVLENMNSNIKNLQNPKEDELELELEDEVQNDKGHFDTDTPERVVAAKPEQDKLLLTIRWKPRKNGSVPQNSIFSNKEIFKYNPRFLADYYESKLKFIPLPQSQNQTNEQQQKKAILIDEAND